VSATSGIRFFEKQSLLAGVSFAALLLGSCLASPALGAEYLVSNETELRNAITAANADGDATATIKLTQSFAVGTGVLPTPSKPMTVDTQGFTLTGNGNTGDAALSLLSTDGNTVTVTGIVNGGAGAAGTTGGNGVYARTPTVLSSIVNNGTITGGAGGAGGGVGGKGLVGLDTVFVNNGTVRGGQGNGAIGGSALEMSRGSVVTNNGLIEGGQGDTGGAGVNFVGPAAGNNSLVNNGTIRGGTGTTNSVNSSGITIRTTGNVITNKGLIEGGTGGIAIAATNGSLDINVVNSGAIKAGTGQTDAIGWTVAPTSGALTLELQKGYDIEGNVVANAAGTADALRLGGTGNETFHIDEIGAAAQYQNFDTFEKTGTSTWLLDGAGTATTDWTVSDGTLLIGDDATDSVTGDITNLATLGGSGTIFGDVTNSGTIVAGSGATGALTISGDYTGNNGVLDIQSVLGGDTSATSQLVVTGNTAGTTTVRVTNAGGAGAQTVEGIKIIDVGGTSAGTFSLQGDYVYNGDQAVVGGAYAYRLYQNGIATPADGDWYLRSVLIATSTAPLYQAGVPIYEVYPQMLQQLNAIGTLQQRVGDRYWETGGDPVTASGPDGVWMRTEGMYGRVDPASSTSGATYDYDLWKAEGGVDGELYQSGKGLLIGGLTAHFGTITGDVSSIYGDGKIETMGQGVGATLTWYGADGFYADAQGQFTLYDTVLKSDLTNADLKGGNSGFGSTLSIEAGRRFASAGSWSITPQAQLIYSSIDFDDFHDAFGAPVSLDRGDSLNGRAGIAFDRDESWEKADGKTVHAKLYGSANLYYEFLQGTAVDVAGLRFKTENDRLSAGVTLGGSYSWNDERTSVYGEATARSSLENVGSSYALSGTAGIRVKW